MPKGKRLTVTVNNHGRLGHTFRLRTASGRNVLAMTTIRPGESKTTRDFDLAAGQLHDVSASWPTTRSWACAARLTVG